MGQPQGASSTAAGRLNGSIGTAAVAADFVLGAGWGDDAVTAGPAVTEGSNAQRGTIAITATAVTPAQATATVTFTFPDGAYTSAPFVKLKSSTNSAGELDTGRFALTSVSTTGFVATYSILPVDTFVYTMHYLVIA